MLEPWEMQWAVWAAGSGHRSLATGGGKLTSSGSDHQIKKQSTLGLILLDFSDAGKVAKLGFSPMVRPKKGNKQGERQIIIIIVK